MHIMETQRKQESKKVNECKSSSAYSEVFLRSSSFRLFHIATVESDDLEEIWGMFNTSEPVVSKCGRIAYTHRSFSCGDVVKTPDGKTWRCVSGGWRLESMTDFVFCEPKTVYDDFITIRENDQEYERAMRQLVEELQAEDTPRPWRERRSFKLFSWLCE